jgi:hypothetical protein
MLVNNNILSNQPVSPISLDSSVSTFNGTNFLWSERVPNGNTESSVLYNDGRTYLSNGMPWNTEYRSLGLLYWYDKNTGFYDAPVHSTEWQGEADNHNGATRPWILNDDIFISQEDRHGINSELWKANKDDLNFSKIWTAGNFARGIFWRTPTSFFMINQKDSTDMSLLVYNGTDFNSAVTIAVPSGVGKRIYTQKPLGRYQDYNGYYHIILSSATSDEFEEYYHLKTLDLQNFVNVLGAGAIDISGGATDVDELRTNGYKICGVNNSVNNLNDFNACIDNAGNLFGIFYKNYEAKLYLVKHNGSAYTETEITSLAGFTVAGQTVSGMINGNAVQQVFLRNNLLHLIIRVTDGAYYKMHLFTSPVSDGLTWTDRGDLTPGINENIHRCKTVENIFDVPNNENFAVYSCKYTYQNGSVGPASIGTVYGLRAAFGTIKTEPNLPHPNTYANRASEVAGVGWDIGYAYDDITTGSGLITQLNDVTGNGNHATATGECYVESNAIKTYGPSYFSVGNVSTFRTNTQFTLAVVAKKIGNGYLLSFGNTADQYQYLAIKTNTGKSVRYDISYTSVAADNIQAPEATKGDNYAIIVVTGTTKMIRFFINGQECFKEFTSGSVQNLLRWANYYNTSLSNMLIGAKITTTPEYTGVDFKEWRYKDEPITYEQRRSLENYWSTLYGITLGDLGTAPTYEPEAEVTFARMSVTPNSTIKGKINDYIVDKKTEWGLALGEHSLRNKVDLLYVMNLGDDYYAYNFASPRFDITKVNSPTYTTTFGPKSNGTTSYLNTNFNPSKHSTWSSSAFFVSVYVVSDATRGNKVPFGLRTSAPLNTARVIPRTTSDTTTGNATTTSGLTISSITSMPAYYAIKRSGTTRYLQRETTSTSGVTSAGAFINGNLFLLAENLDGSPTFYLDASIALFKWGSNTIVENDDRTTDRNYLVAEGVTGI